MSPSSTSPRTTRMPCAGPESSRSGPCTPGCRRRGGPAATPCPPITNQTRPAAGTTRATAATTQRDRPTQAAPRQPAAHEPVRAEDGRDQEGRLQGDHQEPEAGARCPRRPARRSAARGPRPAGRRRTRRSSRPGPGSGCATGTSATAASTTSRMPSHHGAPCVAEPAGDQLAEADLGHRQLARRPAAGPGPAPWSSAGSHHGASSTGTIAERDGGRAPHRAVAHQAGADREPGTDDDQREDDAEPEQQRRERRPEREQERAAPGRPPPAVGLGVGEAERGVGEPRQQGGHGDDAEAALAPGAADDRDQRVGDGTPREQRLARSRAGRPAGRPPAGTARRPTARTARRAPAAPRWRRRGCRRAGSPASASGSTYAGAGTAVPWPSACQDSVCSRHQSPAASGHRRQRAAGHRAERVAGADQRQDHEQGHRDAPPGW